MKRSLAGSITFHAAILAAALVVLPIPEVEVAASPGQSVPLPQSENVTSAVCNSIQSASPAMPAALPTK